MIKNDRQYRISKSKVAEFRTALELAKSSSHGDPLLDLAARDGVASQLETLESDIAEYERLRTGNVGVIQSQGLVGLPRALIRARIAQGLTQNQLAKRLDLPEQQVQRWEGNDYANASLQALAKVANALEVTTREEVFVPTRNFSVSGFLNNLTKVGITKDLLRRLTPPDLAETLLSANPAEELFTAAFRAANLLERFVAIPAEKLLAMENLQPSLTAAATARFKIPATARAIAVHAQAIFANYLAALVSSAWITPPDLSFPRSSEELRKDLQLETQPLSLDALVAYAWSHGIAVVPLRVAGGFHGAVWEIDGRCVVVLKQSAELEARWIYDLLHELGHVARGHVHAEGTIIEPQPIQQNDADITAEDEANEWAQEAAFGDEDRLVQIEEACEIASHGKLQRLKETVPVVAARFHVHAGMLANHLAHRLDEQGNDWWGAAQNLQSSGPSPFDVVRNELLKRIDLKQLNPIDRDLIVRSVSEA
ncbi:MAG: helix-turn-helix transcriptional regulator [Opitutaceae bacterium]|nr:helix-turn-helix transcriptional regulator [Cephaloticoccus sp.]MCP5530504.1 helix-turn-helix transcriptional regulator [Opitutaceae bacterium]